MLPQAEKVLKVIKVIKVLKVRQRTSQAIVLPHLKNF
jgi:hypothetical protein